MSAAEHEHARRIRELEERVRQQKGHDEQQVIRGVQGLKEQHEQEKAQMKDEFDKEKAVNQRRLEILQTYMENMMAQQEANNKIM